MISKVANLHLKLKFTVTQYRGTTIYVQLFLFLPKRDKAKKLWSFSCLKLQKYLSLCPVFQSLKHIPSFFLQKIFEEADAFPLYEVKPNNSEQHLE